MSKVYGYISLTAEVSRQWLEVTPDRLDVSADNVQSVPLVVKSWMGEGDAKIASAVFMQLAVESAVGSDTKVLYTLSPSEAQTSLTYTIPQDSYPSATQITVKSFSDAARQSEISSYTVLLSRKAADPLPVGTSWSSTATYRNGNLLVTDTAVYQWSSPVAGNSDTDPATDISQNPNTTHWVMVENVPIFATRLFLAATALIGQAVFKGNYMMSQMGKIGDAESTDYNDKDFIANFLVDFSTGALNCSKADIKGIINAKTFVADYVNLKDIPKNVGEDARYLSRSTGSRYLVEDTDGIVNLPIIQFNQGLTFEFCCLPYSDLEEHTTATIDAGYNVGISFPSSDVYGTRRYIRCTSPMRVTLTAIGDTWLADRDPSNLSKLPVSSSEPLEFKR